MFAWEGDSLTNRQVLVQLDAAELPAQRDRVAAQLAEAVAGTRKEEVAGGTAAGVFFVNVPKGLAAKAP